MNWLRRLFCFHLCSATFVRHIYGDEIFHSGGKRSLWRCDRCGALVARWSLYLRQ
jgi:hypothetical protein